MGRNVRGTTADALPDQNRCDEGPDSLSPTPVQEPPPPHRIRFPVWAGPVFHYQ
jgi:hypothetical protein